MVREPVLDPANLKRPGGRGKTHFSEDLLKVLPATGLTDGLWQEAAEKTESTFKRLKVQLKSAGLVVQEGGIWKPAPGPESPKSPIGPSDLGP